LQNLQKKHFKSLKNSPKYFQTITAFGIFYFVLQNYAIVFAVNLQQISANFSYVRRATIVDNETSRLKRLSILQ